VPLSNFGGWYLTIWGIYQCFALYLRGRPKLSAPSSGVLKPAILMYGVCAAGNLLVGSPHGMTMVTDAAGMQWRVADMLGASMLVSVFLMGALALAAWLRSGEEPLGSKESADG
jgi:hypothetical protein